jgi:hypothetical protein
MSTVPPPNEHHQQRSERMDLLGVQIAGAGPVENSQVAAPERVRRKKRYRTGEVLFAPAYGAVRRARRPIRATGTLISAFGG